MSKDRVMVRHEVYGASMVVSGVVVPLPIDRLLCRVFQCTNKQYGGIFYKKNSQPQKNVECWEGEMREIEKNTPTHIHR